MLDNGKEDLEKGVLQASDQGSGAFQTTGGVKAGGQSWSEGPFLR